ETLPAIRESDARARFKGNTIHVVRLDDRPESMDSVLDAARGYLNDKEPYGIGNLVLLGLILIYQRFTLHSDMQGVIIKLLKLITNEVIKIIDKYAYDGKQPMVCSQLVFQCYEDGGHKLEIPDPIVSKALSAEAAQFPSLLDRAIQKVGSGKLPELSFLSGKEYLPEGKSAGDQFEELCCLILKLLGKGEGQEISPDLSFAVRDFAIAVYAAKTGMPVTEIMPGKAFDFLKYNESNFVTPGDLLRCSNASQVGEISG
ncbi:MAG: hypothetical protein GWN61_11880, partial [candidate division Zixibacteria bacterium]|nr:hypothetical protein [candidate division Zixibacteria bacterium]NIR64909.1 hypothetical protein [candidate division Zixibacteria bacterium]NIS46715.1 hypothetical protein [candidate division Zixibacteria bacterium]NIU14844.1 hypothetical protein [candidate division Zixibacteria bacterium]NIV06844.1 hypothetical protein [candidate division Zixibacteria bacterium]